MKDEAVVSAKGVGIREVDGDSLLKEIAEWSNRIAKRAYEFFADSGFTDGHDLEDWFRAEKELLKPVALQVKEENDEFLVTAGLPGFEAKDLDIQVNGSRLIIEGKRIEEKKSKEGKLAERECQQIYRMVELPAPVLGDKARAELKKGVLELKLPKAERQKQIKVAAA